jgi:hypothetical protein
MTIRVERHSRVDWYGCDWSVSEEGILGYWRKLRESSEYFTKVTRLTATWEEEGPAGAVELDVCP